VNLTYASSHSPVLPLLSSSPLQSQWSSSVGEKQPCAFVDRPASTRCPWPVEILTPLVPARPQLTLEFRIGDPLGVDRVAKTESQWSLASAALRREGFARAARADARVYDG